MIVSAAIALLLLQPTAAQASPLEGPKWTRLPNRPSKSQLECVPYREDFWSVSLDGGAVTVRSRSSSAARVQEALPFGYTSQKDRQGDRRVLEVAGGWLVGFDQGEFGGGLWWFDHDGRTSRRLRPAKDTPANAADPYRAENVLGFSSLGGQPLVLMGLDHLGGRSGRIFRVKRGGDGSWELVTAAVLDGSPEAWLSEDERLLVVTQGGIWTLESARPLQHSVSLDLGPVGPADSLVRGSDGLLYVGLRHYVLGLEGSGSSAAQAWFAPSNCISLRMRERCDCAPPSP